MDDEQPYQPVQRVFEAGALVQRHMGSGAVHEAIEAANEYATVAARPPSLRDLNSPVAYEALEAAFLVGFGEGVSRKGPPPDAEFPLRAALRAVA